ncbi:MAG TPA: YbjQ family protein [Desulfurococcaceae archaeon]|nr:YbjQ family protein [Desulfurococcaceae archaeon]
MYRYQDFILATTENLPGYRIVRVIGIVSGSVVMAKHLGRDILAALRNIVGGEVKEYTELLAQARNIAIERLVERAKSMGANAVIGLRFSTSAITSGAAEILAYGTAVVVEKEG